MSWTFLNLKWYFLLILIIISQFSIIFTLISFAHTIFNFHNTTVMCLPHNLPVTTDHLICSLKLVEIVWILDRYYSLITFCCFLITPWLTFWWWVSIAGISCKRFASLSSLLSKFQLFPYCNVAVVFTVVVVVVFGSFFPQ